ncbi:MAG: hypothetical protein FJ290_30710 [Planctomycetes bacterium]|nr:hypothetical protein [Planctomycetota bacterium]
MTATCHADVQTLPPPLALTGPLLLPGRPQRIEVRRVTLSAAQEEQLRVRACLQRLAALRRRIELVGASMASSDSAHWDEDCLKAGLQTGRSPGSESCL